MSDDFGDLGPAMEALSDKQRRFVFNLIEQSRNGETNYKAAAQAAGYKGNDLTLRVKGSQLAHDVRVQAAIMEESKKRIVISASLIAVPVVASIALDPEAKNSDRLHAAEMLFNRGGMPAMTEQKITVEHKQPKQMLELAQRLATELGVPLQKLIGVNRTAAPVIDAEFKEVSE